MVTTVPYIYLVFVLQITSTATLIKILIYLNLYLLYVPEWAGHKSQEKEESKKKGEEAKSIVFKLNFIVYCNYLSHLVCLLYTNFVLIIIIKLKTYIHVENLKASKFFS